MSNLGYRHTPEVKEKIRAAKLGSRNPFFGRHHTPETREKMRTAKLGYHHTPEARRKAADSKVGPKNPNWNGGKAVIGSGYVLVLRPERVNANEQRYVREHRIIAEGILGRPLKKTEVVHHINEHPDDNRPCNLLICSRSYHRRLHWLMKRQSERSS